MKKPEKTLEIIDLCKNFGGVVAAENINIEVNEHEIYGIIGPNGAGKTTLFNMISGLFLPTSGDIRYYGQSIVGKRADEIGVLGIARTFQNIRLFKSLSLLDNLLIACQKNIKYNMLHASLRSKNFKQQEAEKVKLCEDALRQIDLYDSRNMISSKLPYGMQRRLEIMRALVTDPKILLLDEPAAGMNEDETAKLIELIRSIRNNYDVTIIIIDHHMDVIMNLCDKISVVNFGKLLMTGTADEVQNSQMVIDAYLGVDE